MLLIVPNRPLSTYQRSGCLRRGLVSDFALVCCFSMHLLTTMSLCCFVFVILLLSPSVERYDPSKDAWEMVAPMADKRINFGVGVMLGFIFVVGGHNGVSHLSSIERYDPHQNQWTVCRPMNEPRTGEFLGGVQVRKDLFNLIRPLSYKIDYIRFYYLPSECKTLLPLFTFGSKHRIKKD